MNFSAGRFLLARKKITLATQKVIGLLGSSIWLTFKRKSVSLLTWVSRVGRAGLHRIWIAELIFSLLLLAAFFALWRYLQGDATAAKDFPSSLISVLAITNAISLLGANTYLARYSAIDKINEIFGTVSKITLDNKDQLNGHPKESKFARRDFSSWLCSRSSSATLDLSNKVRHYTWRPLWDGVWFFGSDEYNRRCLGDLRVFLTFHELLLTAIVILRHVIRLRATGACLIAGTNSGTLGSRRFLESLRQREKFLKEPLGVLGHRDAVKLVELAEFSTHYMFEEFRSHLEDHSWEEYRKLRFVSLFVEYLNWLCYFQLKFQQLRAANVNAWGRRRGRRMDLTALAKKSEYIADIKAKLFELQVTVAPRKALAEKVIQIRLGSLVPIILTASALFIYAVVLPIALNSGTPSHLKFTTAALYSFTCTAMAVNFFFGFWLLVPWRARDHEQWSYDD